MYKSDKNYLSFCIYNYSRYIFLKIENEYENYLSRFNITLPQLRCLWIIKSFPKISVSKISKIGCWSVPTVTNMLKLLEEKNI
ncbi:MarR family transcriptional regulator [Caloramator sp. mosi_1]|uniref:MarR family transcriptional regulator n=1 Tax=Caloramator sp. mosi_1 TaxID=3023090 RepID=UPI003FCE72CB